MSKNSMMLTVCALGFVLLFSTIGLSKTLIFSNNTDSIQKFEIGVSTAPKTLLSGLEKPCGLAWDSARSTLYFDEYAGGSLGQVKLDGSGQSDLSQALSSPSGLAILTTGDINEICWAEQIKFRIRCMTLNTKTGASSISTIITKTVMPVGVAIDESTDKIYWAEGQVKNGAIMRANMDGTEIEVVAAGLKNPQGVAVSDGVVYWAETMAGTIRYISTDNLDDAPSTLIQGLSKPIGVFVDADSHTLYFSETGAKRIQYVDLNVGSSSVKTLLSGLEAPTYLLLVN